LTIIIFSKKNIMKNYEQIMAIRFQEKGAIRFQEKPAFVS
jgi:hypothetical protein